MKEKNSDDRYLVQMPLVLCKGLYLRVVFCNFVLHLCEMCGSNAKSDVYIYMQV